MASVMHAYAGVFLIFFALLKIFDLKGFMNGFAIYDLIATRNSAWGYIYPFIELALGLAYLAFLWPTATAKFETTPTQHNTANDVAVQGARRAHHANRREGLK
jgi:hypothetical protein